tara:strand:+ start:97518 stop:97790 length:273 start_codon:yes stop_codon:yes gene_type:complete
MARYIVSPTKTTVSFNPVDLNDGFEVPKDVYGYKVPLRVSKFINNITLNDQKCKVYKLNESKASALNKMARQQELVDIANNYLSFAKYNE